MKKLHKFTVFFVLLMLVFSTLDVRAGNNGGTALDFDYVNDWVNATNNGAAKRSAASLGMPTAAITAEAWIYPRASRIWDGVVGFLQDNGGTEYGWHLGLAGGNRFEFAVAGGGSGLTYLTTTNTFPLNRWYHLAGTYDGTTMRIYVNGVLEGTSIAQSGPIAYLDSWLAIGNYRDDNENWYFNGMIDEVRIWNYARSQTQLQSSMFGEINGATAGLVAYWRFNEGTGTTTADATGNALHLGTLTNMTPASDWIPSTAPLGDATVNTQTNVAGFWIASQPTTSGGLTIANNSFLVDTGDDVIIGHNNVSGATTSDLPAGVGSRLSRIWYCDLNNQNANGGNLNLTFNLTTAGGGTVVNDATYYSLLQRAGTSGPFATIVGTASSVNTVANTVTFTGVSSGTACGYITLGANTPYVVSITRANPSPTNAASVDFTVTFSKSVSGVDTGDFTLAVSGVSGASVTGVSGSGATRTVTVNTGSGDGTLRLDLVDNDTIVDTYSVPLGGSGAGNGSYNAGEVYTIDKTAPTITITEPNTFPAQSKTITATTSDGILSMSNTTGATCDGTLSFVAYASQTFTSEADNGTRVCYRAVDALGNTSYSLSNAIAGIDTTAPTITITEPNTLPATSKTITAITSDGTLTMSNTTGTVCDGTLTFIAYASQTFTNEADNGTRVCYRAVDTAGNTSYRLSNAIAGIDTTAPTITITEPNTLPATSKTITASASDGTFTMSNTTGATCDGTLTFVAYASQTFTNEADNGTRVCYRAVDALGNISYSLSNAIAGIDSTMSTITNATSTTIDGTYSVGAAINITINFSENISSTGLTITLDNGAVINTGALTNVTSYSGTYTVAAGQNSTDLTVSSIIGTITDAALNSTTNPTVPAGQNISDSKAIVIDTTAPGLTSFTRQNPTTSPTNADTLVLRATFSVDVQNVDATDFTVTGTTATISVAGVGAGPTYSQYDLTVSSGDLANLNGTVGVDLAVGQDITDLALNALPTVEPAMDETYLVNNTAPIVASTDLVAGYTGTGPANFTATFSKDVSVTGGTTGPDSATNPANYLLVNKGVNETADTISCGLVPGAGGVTPDDTQVTVNSVSYNNVTFTSTVTLPSTLPIGSYRLFICGTTSIVDAAGNPLNGGTDYTFDFVVRAAPTLLPATGFPQGRVTILPEQPASKAYASTDMVLEIPSLNQKMTIVGVPQSEKSWDVTWLGNNAGWLEGSAYPTWNGNTVLTGHVWDSFNRPGPFANLKNLKYGDQFFIHAYGMTYTYEVRENKTYWAKTAVSKVFQHEELDWVTLVTCEAYNPLNSDYFFRRAVRAVLISVK